MTQSNNEIHDLVRRLEIASINKQLPRGFVSSSEIAIENSEINTLLGYSTILSLSSTHDDQSLAYEIVTRLLECVGGDNERVVATSNVVFSRLGNFPGRNLLIQRYSNSPIYNLSPSIRLECIARETENTFFHDEERSTVLTDFQYRFLESLNSESSLSVSAPTSAGKSFVLNIDLVRKIKSSSGESIVYVVPTRALISEVANRIRIALRKEELSEVTVRTAPFPVPKDKIKKAAVYVFTQERLMSFINSTDVKPFISSLIVDEAHEIQNGKRGIILQNAIDITLSRFKEVKVLFASPLIKNPAYFLSLFGRSLDGKFFVEQVSPVSQNIILISDVKMKPKEIDVALLSRGKIIPVSRVTANFRLRDSSSLQRANIAFSISDGTESVISFSNGPADAESVAEHISKISKDFQPSEDIKLFVDFIKSEIHEEYPLINCILNGVAFHYGNMPSLVRSGVESLFKSGQIKIICCTSTLLQGVNLPAKHIVIENPMSGDAPMGRADFLNLSGRAGRLLHEFHGNIWCVRPSEWSSECYKGEPLQEISSAINNLMQDGGQAIQDLLDGVKNPQKNDEAEAAFGKLYHDYVTDRNLDFFEKYRNESNSEVLTKTIDEIKKIEISLPVTILESNQSLRPDHLQKLYDYLYGVESITDFVPISPYLEGAKKRMEDILSVFINCFDWEITDRYKSWISFLAYKWIWGEPIGKILSERVSYIKSRDPTAEISTSIRGCLKVIEDAIRFRMVKYFSAYIDILKHVARERNIENEIDTCEPYHIYLEFGSCNRHALNLMALGISRFTALYMQSKFDFSDEVEAEEYLKQMELMNIDTLKMPALCKRELQDLLQ